MATINPGQFTNSLGQNYGLDNVLPPFYLTGATLTAAAAAFPALPIPAYNSLEIRIFIPSLAGADQPALRFNADAGANYQSRNPFLATAATLVTDGFPGADSKILLGASTATGRVIVVHIVNVLSAPKVLAGYCGIAAANAATSPISPISLAGTWFNTTAQITSVTLITGTGQNFNIGSSISIFGGY